MKKCIITLFALLFAQAGSAATKQPNVIVVFVDDLGWTDLGCYGSKFYETPHIDRLAKQGAMFTRAYSSCNVCSPTRASLMTGKYPQRVGFTSWLNPRKPSGPNSAATYIPVGETTIGEAFSASRLSDRIYRQMARRLRKDRHAQTAWDRLANGHGQAWFARILFLSL